MKGNVQVRAVAVKDGTDWLAVGLVREARRSRLGLAGPVGAGGGAALGGAELIACFEGAVAVAEGGRGPGYETMGVPVPVFVCDGWVLD
jgi:hypothetical protein